MAINELKLYNTHSTPDPRTDFYPARIDWAALREIYGDDPLLAELFEKMQGYVDKGGFTFTFDPSSIVTTSGTSTGVVWKGGFDIIQGSSVGRSFRLSGSSLVEDNTPMRIYKTPDNAMHIKGGADE